MEHLCQSGMETLSLRDSSITNRGRLKQLDSINEFVNTRSIVPNGMIYAYGKDKFDCLEKRQHDNK